MRFNWDMLSRRNTVVAAIVVLLVAAGLFIALRPDDSNQSESAGAYAPVAEGTTGTSGDQSSNGVAENQQPVPEIVVRNGQPVSGILEIDANKGDQIKFKVDSDVSEEIHIHGFDLSKDVEAGQTVTLAFNADITGIFEAELENSAVQIAEIQVNP